MNQQSVAIRVKKAGLLTLVQDRGRSGYQAFGLPPGGALDRRAARLANDLLDQPAEHPILEITWQGPVLQFEGQLQMALTGADLSPQLNERPIDMYQNLTVKPGDVLSFGKRKNGCRTYLGIRGEWQVSKWLNSRAALMLGSAIWPPGSRLEKDSSLWINPSPQIAGKMIKNKQRPYYGDQISVRVMPGPEFSWFKQAELDFFVSHAFSISTHSNRMGCRLNNALPGYEAAQELISSGIVPGTVQIVPSGHPVLLLADAQTTGGYPRIANIIDQDLDDVGQLIPGNLVRFIWR